MLNMRAIEHKNFGITFTLEIDKENWSEASAIADQLRKMKSRYGLSGYRVVWSEEEDHDSWKRLTKNAVYTLEDFVSAVKNKSAQWNIRIFPNALNEATVEIVA